MASTYNLANRKFPLSFFKNFTRLTDAAHYILCNWVSQIVAPIIVVTGNTPHILAQFELWPVAEWVIMTNALFLILVLTAEVIEQVRDIFWQKNYDLEEKTRLLLLSDFSRSDFSSTHSHVYNFLKEYGEVTTDKLLARVDLPESVIKSSRNDLEQMLRLSGFLSFYQSDEVFGKTKNGYWVLAKESDEVKQAHKDFREMMKALVFTEPSLANEKVA